MNRIGTFVLALGLAAAGCGGGGGTTSPTPPPTLPPTPSAVVTGTGNGVITVAPSAFSTWCCALRMPIRVAETAGGRAKWDFARLQLLSAGVEVERAEIGSTVLASPPDVTNIEGNSSLTVALIFRVNAPDFDTLRLTLGMTDKTTGRAFNVDVPFNTFSDVVLSNIPLVAPDLKLTD